MALMSKPANTNKIGYAIFSLVANISTDTTIYNNAYAKRKCFVHGYFCTNLVGKKINSHFNEYICPLIF